MKKNLMLWSVLGLILGPVVAWAAVGAGTLEGMLSTILLLLNRVIPILIVLAIIYFIWGVIKYVISREEEEKKKGRDMIIYGIIGLAVIVGMWGLVNLLLNSFDVAQGTIYNVTTPGYIPNQ